MEPVHNNHKQKDNNKTSFMLVFNDGILDDIIHVTANDENDSDTRHRFDPSKLSFLAEAAKKAFEAAAKKLNGATRVEELLKQHNQSDKEQSEAPACKAPDCKAPCEKDCNPEQEYTEKEHPCEPSKPEPPSCNLSIDDEVYLDKILGQVQRIYEEASRILGLSIRRDLHGEHLTLIQIGFHLGLLESAMKDALAIGIRLAKDN